MLRDLVAAHKLVGAQQEQRRPYEREQDAEEDERNQDPGRSAPVLAEDPLGQCNPLPDIPYYSGQPSAQLELLITRS